MGLKSVFLIWSLLAVHPVFANGSHPTLQEKLNTQWTRYSQARELLLQQVQRTDIPVEQRAISREQWEQIVTLDGDNAFTAHDLEHLKHLQQKRIEKAKKQAQLESIIDLDKVRAGGKEKQFCEQVPKGAMLHVHPGATMNRSLAAELLVNVNAPIKSTELLQYIDSTGGNSMLYPEERSWLLTIPDNTYYLSLSEADQKTFATYLFMPAGKQPFARFNGVFSFLDFAMPDWDRYGQVLMAFAKRAVDQGVIYVEFTSGTNETLFGYLASIEKETGLKIRSNQSFNRTRDLATLDKSLQTLLAASHSPYLVGIDFLDNETNNPSLEKGQLLYGTVLQKNLSGEIKLHRTMHSGELGDIRNPRDSMIIGAERLGHGVNLAKDPVALEYASVIREPIEINISSNLRLTDVQSVKEHPFLNYLRLGLPVSLSTDDEGIFDIDINHECEIAIAETDISYAELKQMALNSIQTSFASDEDKAALLTTLDQKFQDFEKAYKGQSLLK